MEIAYRGNMGFCEAQKHAFASWRKGFFNGKILRVNGEDVMSSICIPSMGLVPGSSKGC